MNPFLALTKPRITVMAVFVAAGAALLAPGAREPWTLAVSLLAIGLLVGAANALNQFIEREGDALMERTRNRPLPAGQLEPRAAVILGVVLSAIALPLLFLAVNALTGLLAVIALVNYVGLYTPLKRRTSWALQVGAISGAMPVLMGWTTVTGRLDLSGLLLFALFVLWQLPHFIAITLFRGDEYERAGVRLVVNEKGEAIAKRQCLAYATALLPLSLALVAWGDAGWLFAAVAVVTNAAFIAYGVKGLSMPTGAPWAYRFFLASLVWPFAILGGLFVDVVLQ